MLELKEVMAAAGEKFTESKNRFYAKQVRRPVTPGGVVRLSPKRATATRL